MLSAFFIRLGIGIFSAIPFSLMYVLSDFLYFMMKNVVKYRKKVIWNNLKNSFPDKTDSELTQIMNDAYKNLCDVALEGFKGLSMSAMELNRRYKVINPALAFQDFERGTSVILTGSHFTNWEWGVIGWSLWFEHQVVGIYKPLSNKEVETVLNEKRAAFGMSLAAPSETRAALERHKIEPCMYVLMGDQSPSNLKSAHWLSFLNQETAWLHGVGSIANNYDFPIYYLDTQRVARGFYESTLTLLCPNPKDFSPEEISTLYAAKVEAIIMEKPSDWLWSHKRWKHKKGV